MKITEARFKMADGTEAVYDDDDTDLLPHVRFYVTDLAAAQELIDTIERSRAQKKKSKPAPAADLAARSPPSGEAGEAAGAVPLPEKQLSKESKCEVKGCIYDADLPSKRCRDHHAA